MAEEVSDASRKWPWWGLAASVWVQIASGNAYTFPLYSHSLKTEFGFGQQKLLFLGLANDLGESFSIPTSAVSNLQPFRPWILLLVGCAFAFFGYGILWLAVSKIVGFPYWAICTALIFATNSGSWLSTAVLVTNKKNFPLSRDVLSGILKGYVAHSASVYSLLFTGVLNKSSTNLLLTLTVGLPVICLATMYPVRVYTPTSNEQHFKQTKVASEFLGLCLFLIAMLGKALSINNTSIVTYICFGIIILLLLRPFQIAWEMKCNHSSPETGMNDPAGSSEGTDPGNSETRAGAVDSSGLKGKIEPKDVENTPLLPEQRNVLAEGVQAVCEDPEIELPSIGENFAFTEAIFKPELYLLFFAFFCGIGSVVTVLNNLAQIGIAAGVDDTNVLLAIFGFSNFAGRFGGGYLAELYFSSDSIPGTIWMALAQLLMVVAFVLFYICERITLYFSTALLGISYGVQFSAMVPTVIKLFGWNEFGIIHNIMLLGNPLGAFIFSVLFAGKWYDEEATRQQQKHGLMSSTSCSGPKCFQFTFILLGAVCIVGAVLSIILTWRVYQKLKAQLHQVNRNTRHSE